MSIGGIDGIGKGGGGYIPPSGGGGPPPPPGGPNGPNDDGDDDKKVSDKDLNALDIRSASEIIRELHQSAFMGMYTQSGHHNRSLPSIDSLIALGKEPGVTADDLRMLTELRERVALEEAQKIYRQEQRLEEVRDDIRGEVEAMLGIIIAAHQQLPLPPLNPESGKDESIQGIGNAESGAGADQQYPGSRQDERPPKDAPDEDREDDEKTDSPRQE